MFNRLSSNVLLKSVIALMAAGIVLVLAVGAWDAWRTLQMAGRLADVADVSGQLFRGMVNVRLNRSLVVRALNLDGVPDPGLVKQIDEVQRVSLPALEAARTLLPAIDFPDRDRRLKAFESELGAYLPLDKEAIADLGRPKSQRRAGLANEVGAAADKLVVVIGEIAKAIDGAARNRDAFVDQMVLLKDAAWLTRVNAGDMSILLSNGLAFKKRFTDKDKQSLAGMLGRADAAWEMLETIRLGLPPASPVSAAIEKARAVYLGQDLTMARDRIVAVLSGNDPIVTPVAEWLGVVVPRLMSLPAVAEAALDAAHDHAQAQVASARTNLIIRLVLLAAALVLAAAGIVIVGRRVIRPLQSIQSAMMKVADGDLSVEVPYRDRHDEIGSLADALATFKQNAVEKERIEAEQQKRREQAALRQQAIERHIAAFEAGIGEALQALGSAATDMRRTSDTLTSTAEQTNGQAREAASSSTEASQNVQTVAAASEELSSSIHEISRQVGHAATVAKRAVAETEETDTTVQGLTNAAHKIGEIVSLITAIANQTNLLALNATIEAARAGEAGKGFAVVASEVKSLAGQTAKATEDISGQVGAIQTVADQALEAMRRIGATISEVSAVASSIAAAVEQQGAATSEITRNTQEAARRTRDVSENIGGVQAGADATGAAAGGVKSSAEVLNRQADTLRREVDTFLQNIRAA